MKLTPRSAAVLAIVASLVPAPALAAYDVRDGSGTLLLSGARARVQLATGETLDLAEPGDGALGDLVVTLKVAAARVTLAVRNPGQAPVTLDLVEPMVGACAALGAGNSPLVAYAEGRTMNNPPRVVSDPGEISGSGLLALARGGRAVAVGASLDSEPEAEIEVTHKGGRLGASAGVAGLVLAPGRTLTVALQVAAGSDLGTALMSWSRAAGVVPKPARTGWCSWYALGHPDEPFILGQGAHATALGLEVVQVDDGWERMPGEWEPNERFPGGMKALAAKLREEGAVPGIWLAPFAAALRSAVVREHPGWVLRHASGEPARREEMPIWGGATVALDASLPEVRAYAAELVRRAAHDWGYAYIKLDFLSWGADPARRDRSLTPLGAYRRALAEMRAAAGPGVYLLGCEALLAGSVGLVDAVRTGSDASLEPGHQALTLAASARRLHWGRVYALDPDVVMVRDGVSESDAVARAWFPVLAGAAFFSGDPISGLKPERLALLKAALAARGHATDATSVLAPGLAAVAARGGGGRALLSAGLAAKEGARAVRELGTSPLVDPITVRELRGSDAVPEGIRLLLEPPARPALLDLTQPLAFVKPDAAALAAAVPAARSGAVAPGGLLLWSRPPAPGGTLGLYRIPAAAASEPGLP